MRVVFNLVAIIFLVLTFVEAVDKSNFKTCEQSSFCRRCRKTQPGHSSFVVVPESVSIHETSITANVVNRETSVSYHLVLSALADSIFRLTVNEKNPIKERFQVPQVLSQLKYETVTILEKTSESIKVKSGVDNVAILYFAPLKLDLFSGDDLLISTNARGLMKFEHQRKKSDVIVGKQEDEILEPSKDENNTQEEDPGAWEENFKSHHDSKPYGPTAVALDFSFHDAHSAYGLPEHADSLLLKSTKNSDPYRLYNFDVFEYELDSKAALYAAIPFILGLGKKASGVFWLNSAETWVDVAYTPDNEAGGVMSSIVNLVSGKQNDDSSKQVDVHFMSESGIIDAFFHLGPSPKDVFYQYSKLTGTGFLPPYFSLGHHQCRWNYIDENDVKTVNENFDRHDLSMDVIWLDIEYTDGKKYFTWDPIKFPNSEDMINHLTAKGRKLVVIIDPHIKRDDKYFLHQAAEQNGFYVKNKDRKDYEGWCWPGSSSYLDFFNPKARAYYESLYSLDHFKGTTNDTFIWNDMNEPSVFNGPEVTMPKDCIHYGDVEHRELHNIYGYFQIMATYNGLLKRSPSKRPFILTRSSFAGGQRYAAIWTGDNIADWSHLKISFPMCLSFAISGFSFCGADVGGFFGNPNPELLVRWYQTGIFLPFFRAHSHIDTRRREPWLFDETTLGLIRQALRLRYSMLPFIYTTFFEHTQNGSPVIRPLWAEFPEDAETYNIDHELFIGNTLLVRPVQESAVTSVTVYLPGKNEIWYDFHSHQPYKSGKVDIPVDLSSIPCFQRGGTILPLRERVRRSSILSLHDPITLIVALSLNGSATGTLYLDDGESFNYVQSEFLLLKLEYKDNKLTSKNVQNGIYKTSTWVEKVLIVGAPVGVKKARISSRSVNSYLETKYDKRGHVLTIRKPGALVTEDWSITLGL